MQKVENLQEQNKQLIAELKEKEQLEQSLVKKCESLNKNTSRQVLSRFSFGFYKYTCFLGPRTPDEF